MENRFEGDKKTDIISNTHTFYSNIGESDGVLNNTVYKEKSKWITETC